MTSAPDGSGYFLYHSIGQYPGKAEAMSAGLAGFARVWSAPDDAQWGYALGIRQRFIELWRGMLRAPEGTVTTCESVTAGLYSLIGALPPEVLRGRRLLVAGDCFPSLHSCWRGCRTGWVSRWKRFRCAPVPSGSRTRT